MKCFSCSNQLSMKFILLINGKMLNIVGILTCIRIDNGRIDMGLDVRKPVFGGLRRTNVQTRLRFRTV